MPTSLPPDLSAHVGSAILTTVAKMARDSAPLPFGNQPGDFLVKSAGILCFLALDFVGK